MYTNREKSEIFEALTDVIEDWLEGVDNTPWFGEDTTRSMAQAACNVLFAIADAQDWLKNNDMLKKD